jgi:putative transposase
VGGIDQKIRGCYTVLWVEGVKPNPLGLGYKPFTVCVANDALVIYTLCKLIAIQYTDCMKLATPEKEYHTTHSWVYSCQYHVVFCPKYRRKVLADGIDDRLKELVVQKQEEYGYRVLGMEVMPDHVHLLLDVNPQIGIKSVVSRIKGFTSHELRNEFPSLKSRLPTLWTRSKFVSTVGSVSMSVVMQYIEDQKGK